MPVYAELPRVLDLFVSSAAPTQLLERRMMKRGNAAIVQVKVRWGEGSPAATTWEDYEVLRQRFPSTAIWKDSGASSQKEAQS